MVQQVYTSLNFNENEIKNVSFEKLAADPSGAELYEGRFWENTTEHKYKWYDGVKIRVIISEEEIQNLINQIGQSQGGFDASSGLLPTVANLIDGDTQIRRGDYWDITVAGTIAGITGDDVLDVGDVLKFVGTNPATPAHWLGIQRNLNDTLLGNTKTERQTVNLVAQTPLTVSATIIPDIFTIQVYNSAGEMIMVDISKGANPNQRVLKSNKSLTGVVVEMTGATA